MMKIIIFITRFSACLGVILNVKFQPIKTDCRNVSTIHNTKMGIIMIKENVKTKRSTTKRTMLTPNKDDLKANNKDLKREIKVRMEASQVLDLLKTNRVPEEELKGPRKIKQEILKERQKSQRKSETTRESKRMGSRRISRRRTRKERRKTRKKTRKRRSVPLEAPEVRAQALWVMTVLDTALEMEILMMSLTSSLIPAKKFVCNLTIYSLKNSAKQQEHF